MKNSPVFLVCLFVLLSLLSASCARSKRLEIVPDANVATDPQPSGPQTSSQTIDFNNPPSLKEFPKNVITIQGRAMIALSHSPSVDFGDSELAATHTIKVEVGNVGALVARNLSASIEASPQFRFAGGSYPGTGGDCHSGLEPLERCHIVFEYTPNEVANHRSSFSLSYDSSVGQTSIQVPIRGEVPILYRGISTLLRFKEADQSTSFADSSGNANPASCSDCPQKRALASGLEAFHFDGDSSVAIAHRENLSFASAMTLHAVTKVSQKATLPNWPVLMMKTSTTSWTDGYGIYLNSPNGDPNQPICVFIRHYSSYRTCATPERIFGALTITATYNQETLKLFFNGILAKTEAFSQPITTNQAPLRIGSGLPGRWNWDGVIEQAATWTRALSESEVRLLHSMINNRIGSF